MIDGARPSRPAETHLGRLLVSLAKLALGLSSLAAIAAGCDDGRKASEQSAVDMVEKLVPVAREDVAEVRRGMPEGAKKLAPMLDPDTLANPLLLQKTISRTRALVHDLDVAKSTFFTITDATGTSLRSEVDPDLLTGRSLVAAFPSLKGAIEGKEAEAFGQMPEVRGVRTGPDLAWVVAEPIKDDHAKTTGLFVTGWSMRLYVRRLEFAAQNAARDIAEKSGKKNPPLVYVFIVKGKTAYGGTITPEVNAQAVEGVDPIAKSAGGLFRTNLDITGRVFGLAVERLPELGDDAALAVLASEI